MIWFQVSLPTPSQITISLHKATFSISSVDLKHGNWFPLECRPCSCRRIYDSVCLGLEPLCYIPQGTLTYQTPTLECRLWINSCPSFTFTHTRALFPDRQETAVSVVQIDALAAKSHCLHQKMSLKVWLQQALLYASWEKDISHWLELKRNKFFLIIFLSLGILWENMVVVGLPEVRMGFPQCMCVLICLNTVYVQSSEHLGIQFQQGQLVSLLDTLNTGMTQFMVYLGGSKFFSRLFFSGLTDLSEFGSGSHT